MDNEREPESELSEETLRLVRDLGDQLEREPLAGDVSSPFRTLRTGPDDELPAFRARPLRYGIRSNRDEMLHELKRLDMEILDLTRQRDELQARLSEIERSPVSEVTLAQTASPALAAMRVPDYLRGVAEAIPLGRPRSFWLHGEDARERRRAVDAVDGLLMVWLVAVVDLVRDRKRRPSDRDEFESFVRRAWDRWPDVDDRRTRHMLAALARQISGFRAPGVAVVLSEFPARDGRAAPFLEWLTRGGAFGSIPIAIFVSTESPPPAGLERTFTPVLCESRAARLGRRLAAARLRRGWNREELAKRSGIERGYLTMVEGGLREDVSERILQRLADTLGVPIEELTGDSG